MLLHSGVEQWVWEPGAAAAEAIYAVRYGNTALNKAEADAGRMLEICRAEWGIENGLHHRRDVTFREDNSSYRRGSGPHVLASLRNLALGLILGAGQPNVTQGRREFDWQLTQHLARLSA